MSQPLCALVSGANRGLGLETSRQLARRGIRVFMGARDARRGAAAAEALRGQGLAVEAVHLDVTAAGHIQRVAAHLAQICGRLDILVNNAGTLHPEDRQPGGSVLTVPEAVVRETFEVNFHAPLALTRTLLPLVRQSPAGRIVMISSILGSLTLQSDPASGLGDFRPFAYDASKTALNQLTVHLAHALTGTPIKVNAAHPGWVNTALGGAQAPLTVEEGARTAVWLATLPENGPSGGFFHLQDPIPW